jgi:hypothetical protein
MREANPEKLAVATKILEGGGSINSAARTSGLSYARAKRLKAELSEPGGLAAPELNDDLYDLTLQVPGNKADAIFSTFTVEEKLTGISHVLQERLNRALGEDGEEGEDDGS